MGIGGVRFDEVMNDGGGEVGVMGRQMVWHVDFGRAKKWAGRV